MAKKKVPDSIGESNRIHRVLTYHFFNLKTAAQARKNSLTVQNERANES